MKGYSCGFDGNFHALILPVREVMDPLYWFINQFSGPIDCDWFFEGENEALIERYSINFPCIENTSLNLFRPGMLAAFGAHMVRENPQEVYFGIRLMQRQADGLEKLANRICDESWPEVFVSVMETNQAILFYYDSWEKWNMFSSCDDLLEPLLSRYEWSEADSENLR